ncbi:MAG: tetratricopeptide repeat protein [Planctomycetota bacterium]|jgi:tetratricopeptide (TPR) repeat protein
MRVQLAITLCLGIMAGLYGASPAAQDSADPSGVLQNKNLVEDSLQPQAVQVGQGYRGLRRQLMWDQVESIEEPSNQFQTDILDDLIRQLRSLEIPQKSTSQEPDEPMPVQMDAAEDSPLPEEVQVVEESIKPALENELVVRLEKLDKVVSPLQLADVLYRQGHYEQALKNYCTVYEKLSEDRIADRQWILFQKANCCRHSDLNEVIRLYNELIKSFPNSKWAAAANSQLKMIEWTRANQIKDLLEIEANDTDSQ